MLVRFLSSSRRIVSDRVSSPSLAYFGGIENFRLDVVDSNVLTVGAEAPLTDAYC